MNSRINIFIFALLMSVSVSSSLQAWQWSSLNPLNWWRTPTETTQLHEHNRSWYSSLIKAAHSAGGSSPSWVSRIFKGLARKWTQKNNTSQDDGVPAQPPVPDDSSAGSAGSGDENRRLSVPTITIAPPEEPVAIVPGVQNTGDDIPSTLPQRSSDGEQLVPEKPTEGDVVSSLEDSLFSSMTDSQILAAGVGTSQDFEMLKGSEKEQNLENSQEKEGTDPQDQRLVAETVALEPEKEERKEKESVIEFAEPANQEGSQLSASLEQLKAIITSSETTAISVAVQLENRPNDELRKAFFWALESQDTSKINAVIRCMNNQVSMGEARYIKHIISWYLDPDSAKEVVKVTGRVQTECSSMQRSYSEGIQNLFLATLQNGNDCHIERAFIMIKEWDRASLPIENTLKIALEQNNIGIILLCHAFFPNVIKPSNVQNVALKLNNNAAQLLNKMIHREFRIEDSVQQGVFAYIRNCKNNRLRVQLLKHAVQKHFLSSDYANKDSSGNIMNEICDWEGPEVEGGLLHLLLRNGFKSSAQLASDRVSCVLQDLNQSYDGFQSQVQQMPRPVQQSCRRSFAEGQENLQMRLNESARFGEFSSLVNAAESGDWDLFDNILRNPENNDFAFILGGKNFIKQNLGIVLKKALIGNQVERFNLLIDHAYFQNQDNRNLLKEILEEKFEQPISFPLLYAIEQNNLPMINILIGLGVNRQVLVKKGKKRVYPYGDFLDRIAQDIADGGIDGDTIQNVPHILENLRSRLQFKGRKLDQKAANLGKKLGINKPEIRSRPLELLQ